MFIGSTAAAQSVCGDLFTQAEISGISLDSRLVALKSDVQAAASTSARLAAAVKFIELAQALHIRSGVETAKPGDYSSALRAKIQEIEAFARAHNLDSALTPAFDELSFRELMLEWGARQFPLGMITEIARADGINWEPVQYAYHDAEHVVRWFKAVEKRARLSSKSVSEVLREFERVNSRLIAAIDQSSATEVERARLYYAWFKVSHERDAVVLSHLDLDNSNPFGYASALGMAMKTRIDLPTHESPEFVAFVGVDPNEWSETFNTLTNLLRGVE